MQMSCNYDCTRHFVRLPYKITGKERDAESGNDYFGARYYASNMGRWMSPDWAAKAEPVPYAKLDDPQSLNLYSYVGNNPLSRADADGHCDWCKNVAQWVSVHVASVGIGIQNVRNSYNAAAGAATTPAARDAAKAAARAQGPALGRAAAAQAAADPARTAARAAKNVQRPLHVRDVTFKKAPRSRPTAAENLTLNLGQE